MKDPLAAADLIREARAKWAPILEAYGIPPLAAKLLLAYFGDNAEGRPLKRAELAKLPCLTRSYKHERFCEQLVWALADPEARQWVEPRFYGEE